MMCVLLVENEVSQYKLELVRVEDKLRIGELFGEQ